MFPKSTISFKRQNANDGARRKIADACSTAAIVAELFHNQNGRPNARTIRFGNVFTCRTALRSFT
jgi:hypothetical protein